MDGQSRVTSSESEYETDDEAEQNRKKQMADIEKRLVSYEIYIGEHAKYNEE